MPQSFCARVLVDESLHKYTIDSIILHPLEMPQNGLVVEGAEDLRLPAIGMQKWCRIPLIGIQLADIGPKIDFAAPGLKTVLPFPMSPTARGAVTLCGEPSLIAAHHFAG